MSVTFVTCPCCETIDTVYANVCDYELCDWCTSHCGEHCTRIANVEMERFWHERKVKPAYSNPGFDLDGYGLGPDAPFPNRPWSDKYKPIA